MIRPITGGSYVRDQKTGELTREGEARPVPTETPAAPDEATEPQATLKGAKK